MKKSLIDKLPQIAIAIVLLSYIIIDHNLGLWKESNRVIEHDVRHYYGYLPLVFIYDDIKIEGQYSASEGIHIWHKKTPEGVKIMKTTSGLAMLYSPFFLLAHAYTKHLSDFDANGYTPPYKLALLFSALFYLWLGLLALYKLLDRLSFTKETVFLCLIVFGLGTHLLFYSTFNAGYSHVYSFTLSAVFLLFVQSWVSEQKFWKIIVLGLTLGLITLIRPTNIIIGLALVLWRKPESDWSQHLRFLFNKKTLLHFSVIPLFALVPLIPQMVYWHHITGSILYYSYGEEGFFFDSPQILNGLFSFRKGWLIYTPAMTMAILGIFFMQRKVSHLRPLVLVFVLINCYIVFSWWCWWYGGSFGQRALIDSYPVLAIPLAALIDYLLVRNTYFTKAALIILVPFFVWLNIFQSFQYEKGSLHYDAMTRELYFKQFGKYEQVKGFYELARSPDYDAARRGEEDY